MFLVVVSLVVNMTCCTKNNKDVFSELSQCNNILWIRTLKEADLQIKFWVLNFDLLISQNILIYVTYHIITYSVYHSYSLLPVWLLLLCNVDFQKK